jgi:predicted nucleic acid-binding protein
MRVVDASVVLAVITEPTRFEADIAALEAETALYAPHIIDLEVINGLRKMLLSKRISAKQADDAISILTQLPLFRCDVSRITSEIWTLRDNFTAYDAAYLALAKTLDVPLMTRDERFASHAKRIVSLTV